ncbi:unnamed protein product [Polarella glacialis]|uniref:Amidohydrolase-related domain-containing protein n=1 Tax=Polarella glacialis TaxID=89957 RepID=A0A813KIW6_POLGL|nr:unnamed protein product [Polarella glacialis]
MGAEAVVKAQELKDGLLRLDAKGLFVLPGLIDAHCHVTFLEPQSNDELFFHRQSEGLTAILAAHNVQKLLLSGCTGFLDADVLYNVGCDLRDAIECGAVQGPRMSTGGNALLTAVGGTAGQLLRSCCCYYCCWCRRCCCCHCCCDGRGSCCCCCCLLSMWLSLSMMLLLSLLLFLLWLLLS